MPCEMVPICVQSTRTCDSPQVQRSCSSLIQRVHITNFRMVISMDLANSADWHLETGVGYNTKVHHVHDVLALCLGGCFSQHGLMLLEGGRNEHWGLPQ